MKSLTILLTSCFLLCGCEPEKKVNSDALSKNLEKIDLQVKKVIKDKEDAKMLSYRSGMLTVILSYQENPNLSKFSTEDQMRIMIEKHRKDSSSEYIFPKEYVYETYDNFLTRIEEEAVKTIVENLDQ